MPRYFSDGLPLNLPKSNHDKSIKPSIYDPLQQAIFGLKEIKRHVGNWQDELKKRQDQYDEQFFNSIGIHKVNGHYRASDLDYIHALYERKYIRNTEVNDDGSAKCTIEYHWQLKEQPNMLDTLESYQMEKPTHYRGYVIFLRTVMGTPNGYVLIKPFQNGYEMSSGEVDSINCHGGITWDQKVNGGRVIGWDSNHYGDFSYRPPMHVEPSSYEHVWTDEEALVECKNIVDQLLERKE